jgi:signal peptidase I
VKSELIPEEPDLKCEDSKAGNGDVERCEGEEETTGSGACLASGIGPGEQGVAAGAGARRILSAEMKAEIIEYVQAFAVAIVLAAFIITFIAQSFVVEGSSMEPSLHNRERLLVNKLVYRFRKPELGDIMVFRYPANPKRRFIKRVIGVPGDEVEVRDGFVILNGMTLDESYTRDLTYGYFGPETVPDGHYFVLGDNRNNSDDSRYPDVGFVPMANIVGKASLIWWPPGRMGLIRNPEARLVKP